MPQKPPSETHLRKREYVKSWSLIAVAIVAALVAYQVLPFEAGPKKGLTILIFIAVLWLTEAVHITITAIFIPILAVLMGVYSEEAKPVVKALSNFANPTIYLFFGGFGLATALHVQKLDKKIAMKIIELSGSRLGYAIFAIAGVAAALSMWVSNTATAAMMLPLVLGILTQLDEEKERNTFVFALLAVAYACSIGGLGTIIGSPPNAIASERLKYEFVDWMKVGFPLMCVMLPWMLFVLYMVFKPDLKKKVTIETEEIPWTKERIVALVVFGVTAVCWMFSAQIRKITGLALDDTLIAMSAVVAIAVLRLATWKEIMNGTEWDILLLFGGGLTLGNILSVSGASKVLGQEVGQILGQVPIILVIFIVMAFIVCLTEFTSNTASAALLVPMFGTIAVEMGLPEELLVLIIGVGASCAFMMPVGTPPNAIVYGTGHIKQREMIKAGFFLHLGNIIFVPLYIYFFVGV